MRFMILIFLFVVLFQAKCPGQGLFINEMMSSNQNFLFDEDGDDSDWIEIFNSSDQPITLLGYFLSDKENNVQRWAFPDTVIQPKQFLLVFASGKDRAITGRELHTNFSVSSSGETLLLSFLGVVLHMMPAVELETNQSYGLETDGNLPFVIFLDPTPGASNNTSPPATRVFFSERGGVFENQFTLSIWCESPDADIYYSIDGTTPTTSSFLYSGSLEVNGKLRSNAKINQIQMSPPKHFNPPEPIMVPKAVVVRAAAFDSTGNQVSDVVTESFFIKEMGIDHGELPLVSICADHDDLFGFERGIFVPGIHYDEDEPRWSGNYNQRGIEWERVINFEYYEDETLSINHLAGLRIHGNITRTYPQKALRLYARGEYGRSNFEHRFFDEKPMTTYKRLVLKPFYASWSQAGVEDYITNKMAKNTKVDYVASKPVVIYVNGEYWGVYFLHERIDERYLEANFNIDPEKVDLIECWNGTITAGRNQEFLNLVTFIEINDLSIDFNYQVVSNLIDIDNFIDYQIFEIYVANRDWPANNMKCWREQKASAKWRWIFFDGDAALQYQNFKAFANALDTSEEGWPTNARSTLFFRKLMRNQHFRQKFFDRLEFLLNSAFAYSATSPYYQEVIEKVGGEIQRQVNRFRFPENYNRWYKKTLVIKEFLSLRPCIVANQTKKMFFEAITVGVCDYKAVSVSEINLFPNPNDGRFYLYFNSSESAPAYVRIYNTLGQLVVSFEQPIIEGDNTLYFELPDLPSGLLHLGIFTDKQLFGTKMVTN